MPYTLSAPRQPVKVTGRREPLEIGGGVRILLREEDLKDIAQKPGVVLALKFGSSVTGQVHPKSDVDLAVLLDHSAISLREQTDLLQDLQSLFPDGEIDLLINHADPVFLKKITDACQLFYGPPEKLQALKLYAFKRYQDHRKFFEMEPEFAAHFIAANPAAR